MVTSLTLLGMVMIQLLYDSLKHYIQLIRPNISPQQYLEPTLQLNKYKIERVSNFTYLGHIFKN